MAPKLLILTSIATICQAATAFQLLPSKSSSAPPRSSTQLHISNLLGNINPSSSSTPQLPKDVKEAISKCREATQKGLEKRLSRMDIEFPVGTKFGVEKKGGGRASRKKNGGKLASAMDDDDNDNNGVTRDMLDTSDRELGRLFVEMFQPLGGDHISIVFHDENLADVARKNWKGDLGAECKIMAMNRGKKIKSAIKGMGMGGGGGRKSKKKGFAAKMNEEFSDESSGPFTLPEGCEVALFVAPTVKDLVTVKKICSEVGMGTLVVLLNARLSLVDNFGSEENEEFFKSEFEPTFYLSIAPQEAAPGCLMHRAYPNDWIIARRPKVGAPKTIASFQDLPTEEECREAYDKIEIGDVEKAAENVLENVASWLN